MAFQDYFSERSVQYARHRPTYPAALFEFLAGSAPGRQQAWDAGTGSGQAATGLAEHFAAVRATDPSRTQLAAARRHPRVTYDLGDEGESGLADQSCDLVAAAQAAHWFDMDRFAGEARRVLRPGGVVAVWGYGLCTIDPGTDEVIRRFYTETTGPFWPPDRRHVDEGYRTLAFPFVERAFPACAIETSLSLGALGDYLRTWSAVQRMLAAGTGDPVDPLLVELARGWGDPALPRRVRWPLFGRIGAAGR